MVGYRKCPIHSKVILLSSHKTLINYFPDPTVDVYEWVESNPIAQVNGIHKLVLNWFNKGY